MLLFGSCDIDDCENCHTFTVNDKLDTFTNSKISFEILSIESPNIFNIKVLSHPNNELWCERKKKLDLLLRNIDEFYSKTVNCKIPPTINTNIMYAINLDQKWRRCKVVKFM